jgi:hypothetical protein
MNAKISDVFAVQIRTSTDIITVNYTIWFLLVVQEEKF